MKRKKLIKLIQDNLSDDLRKPKYKGHPNRLKGHCYVASEAFKYLSENPDDWKPGTLRHESDIHWVLKHRITGEIVDLTVGQFKTVPLYATFRGRGFLTKLPSKRTQILIGRIKNEC